MRLSDQMKIEMASIFMYVRRMDPVRTSIRTEMVGQGLTPKIRKYVNENSKQLSSYKVRLENLLCETDLKEGGQ